MIYFRTTGLAAGLLLGGAVSASAALLDFTVDGSILVGTHKGVGYTVTGVPVAPNQTQNFDGNAADVLAPLALENDGIGIQDDEITGPALAEIVTITFDRAVTLTDLYFLDLFGAPSGASQENPIVTVDGVQVALTFAGALEAFPGTGYAEASVGPVKGTVFTFASDDPNDDEGDPDYALAALGLAPIPLPAGALLLGTALAGFGVARRRKA